MIRIITCVPKWFFKQLDIKLADPKEQDFSGSHFMNKPVQTIGSFKADLFQPILKNKFQNEKNDYDREFFGGPNSYQNHR